MPTLDDFARTSTVDKVLVRLLNERASGVRDRTAEEGAGVDIYQPEREKQVLEHVRNVAEGPLARLPSRGSNVSSMGAGSSGG
jgi:chorismate mutase